jgi:hypothetical protein
MATRKLPTRRSIRLPAYDYASAGAYLITICAHQRRTVLGEIAGSETRLSALGHIVFDAWHDLPNHHPRVSLDAFVVMPNHMHGILFLLDATEPGAAGRAPTLNAFGPPRPEALSAVVRSFKSTTTRKINLLRGTPSAAAWQRTVA